MKIQEVTQFIVRGTECVKYDDCVSVTKATCEGAGIPHRVVMVEPVSGDPVIDEENARLDYAEQHLYALTLDADMALVSMPEVTDDTIPLMWRHYDGNMRPCQAAYCMMGRRDLIIKARKKKADLCISEDKRSWLDMFAKHWQVSYIDRECIDHQSLTKGDVGA